MTDHAGAPSPSPSASRGEPSLAAVKASAQEREREIASLVPPEVVAGITTMETGSFLSCGDGRHAWSGRTTVSLLAGAEPTRVLRTVERALHTRYGEAVRWERTGAGARRLVLSLQHGEEYAVSPGTRGDAPAIWIDSYSRCIVLPDGVWPGGRY
jgi:hypothetical protein